jgi:hypothetical protein
MKIDATPSMPTQSALSAARSSQGDLVLSFDQLLEAGVTFEVQRQQRAFGFSELGVLRPCSTETAPQTPAMDEGIVGGMPRGVETLMRATVTDVPIVLLQTASSQPETSGGTPVAQTFLDLDATRLQAAPGPRQTIVALQHAPIFRAMGQRQMSAPRTLSRQLPQSPQAKRFSLVVSEQDGAVQIIAGAPQLGAEAKERLRKAAALLAAEFGVTLGEFTINGVFVDAPAPTTGASDGDFAG